mmetsp:Transcript_372/g.384  ORF Transcript_372/g.384 Transcript_372/m.384 type:complete len:82 (-) Transcript_372:229-474(-)
MRPRFGGYCTSTCTLVASKYAYDAPLNFCNVTAENSKYKRYYDLGLDKLSTRSTSANACQVACTSERPHYVGWLYATLVLW